MLLLFPLSAFFVVLSQASLDTRLPTDQCTSHQQSGRTDFCGCTGRCSDGTALGDPGGQCEFWYDDCKNTGNPSCGSNQIFKTMNRQVVRYGNCGDGADCYRVQYGNTWECCDCPTGYWAQAHDCEGYMTVPGYCLGCGQGESLKLNPNTQNYACDGPTFRNKACNMVKANQALLDGLGLAQTAFGAFCPSKGPFAIVKALVVDAMAIAKAATTNGQEHPAEPLKAILQVDASLTSLTLGVIGTAMFGEEIAAAWAIACAVNGAIGLLMTAAKFFANNDVTCPKSKFKRVLGIEMVDTGLEQGFERRQSNGNTYNPCLELFNYVSNTFTVPSSINSACDDVSQYYIGDTFNAGVANTSIILNQFCSQYRSSGNYTILSTYSDLLTAIYAAIPYCNATSNSTLTSSISNSATSLSKTTITIASPSTSSKISTITKPTSSSVPTTLMKSSSTTTKSSTSSKSSPSSPSSFRSTTTITSSSRSSTTSSRQSSSSTSSLGIPSSSSSSRSSSSRGSSNTTSSVISTKTTLSATTRSTTSTTKG